MKRKGTSKFVRELITGWLKEITDHTILNEFEKLIKELGGGTEPAGE